MTTDVPKTAEEKAKEKELRRSRRVVFAYDLAWVIGLAVVAVVYFRYQSVSDLVPEPIRELPIWMVWFGALGGVAFSFKGVYDHGTDWKLELGLWHFGHPISGAIAGGVTYVLLWAVNPAQRPAVPTGEVAAFIVGTQDRLFFQFLNKVGELVLRTDGKDGKDGENASAAAAVEPAAGNPPPAGQG